MSPAGLFALRPEDRRVAVRPLVPECLVFRDGAASPVEVGSSRGRLLVVTLEVYRVTEQDGLLVSVWGSADKSDWGTTPLLTFPTKSYCGVYSALLNLANKPEITCLRVHWNLRHCLKGESTPAFGFSVFSEESGSRVTERRRSVYPRLAVLPDSA
jgi:hypothetical protein